MGWALRLRRGVGASGWGLAAVFAAALLIGCEENAYVAPPPPEVGVSNPVVRDVTLYAELFGQTEAVQTVEVRARVEGILLEALAAPGAVVREGDLLFRIDPDVFIAERDAAAAKVQRAEAELQLAQVKLDRTRRAEAQRAANEVEVLEAEAAAETAAAEVEVARRELAVKQLSVDYTDVEAPLTGELEEGAPDIGSLVGGLGSGRLTRIHDTSSVHVWVTVPDRVFLRRVAPDMERGEDPAYPIEVSTEADEGYPHSGVINYIDPAVDPETGTLRFRAIVENGDGALKPGLFVRCRLVSGELENALLVPAAAVGSGQIGSYVLVVNGEGVVQVRPVRPGPIEGRLRVIESGLEPGDRVVVRGILRARPGQTVTAVNEPIGVTSKSGAGPSSGAG